MAKFMPCYDGPYTIIETDKEHSTVTLILPHSTNIFPTFHMSQVIPYIESDTDKFPSCHFKEPDPIITEDGNEEQYIDKYWMHADVDRVINTWSGGMALARNTMNGCLVPN